jgi:predicted DNA-binding protein
MSDVQRWEHNEERNGMYVTDAHGFSVYVSERDHLKAMEAKDVIIGLLKSTYEESENYLKKRIEAKDAEIKKLQSDIQCMVKKAADKNLSGYRELGQMCAEKDAQLAEKDRVIEQLKNECKDLMSQHISEGTMHRETIEAQINEIERLNLKIQLLEACREYDATGKNRPDGYIFTGHDVSERQSGKS